MVMLGVSFHSNADDNCDIKDLQKCSSCDGLEKAIEWNNPDYGEYYRGVYWNGLFGSYRLNCIDIGKKLLEHHANPNLGGTFGSFIITLSRAWPHNKKNINKKWAELILGYSPDANWKIPFTNESTKEVLVNEEISIDYPDINKMLIDTDIQNGKN